MYLNLKKALEKKERKRKPKQKQNTLIAKFGIWFHTSKLLLQFVCFVCCAVGCILFWETSKPIRWPLMGFFKMGLSTNKSTHLLKKGEKKKKNSPTLFGAFLLTWNCHRGKTHLEEISGENSKTFWGHKDGEHKVEILLGGKVSFFFLDRLHLDINLCHFFCEASSLFPTMHQIPRRLILKLNFLLFTVTSVPLTSSKSVCYKLAANFFINPSDFNNAQIQK